MLRQRCSDGSDRRFYLDKTDCFFAGSVAQWGHPDAEFGVVRAVTGKPQDPLRSRNIANVQNAHHALRKFVRARAGGACK